MKNKGSLLLLVLLISAAGCGGKKNKKASQKVVSTNVDIPVHDGISTFFDEDLGEFALEDTQDVADANPVKSDDFSFEDAEQKQFKAVYFAFDGYNIKKDQEATVAYDMAQIKESLAQAEQKGEAPVVIIEGHACHSAGSAVYNLALSEKRAKVLADQLVVHGIAKEHIKIVGRGIEMPAVVNGHICTGNREQQAPNRRDEIRVMFS